MEFMKWFPDAFLASGVLKLTHGGIEMTAPALWVRMLNHYATALLHCIVKMWHVVVQMINFVGEA